MVIFSFKHDTTTSFALHLTPVFKKNHHTTLLHSVAV
jgi:hypothetical protein